MSGLAVQRKTNNRRYYKLRTITSTFYWFLSSGEYIQDISNVVEQQWMIRYVGD